MFQIKHITGMYMTKETLVDAMKTVPDVVGMIDRAKAENFLALQGSTTDPNFDTVLLSLYEKFGELEPVAKNDMLAILGFK